MRITPKQITLGQGMEKMKGECSMISDQTSHMGKLVEQEVMEVELTNQDY